LLSKIASNKRYSGVGLGGAIGVIFPTRISFSSTQVPG
jgi:hypothetical protein